MRQRRDERPMARRQTDFGFSYMAPVGAAPPARWTRRGCLVIALAILALVLGIGLIVAGTQYVSLVTTLEQAAKTRKPTPVSVLEQSGAAITRSGVIVTVIAVLWLLGVIARHRRRLGLPVLPRRGRGHQPAADEPEADADSDLF